MASKNLTVPDLACGVGGIHLIRDVRRSAMIPTWEGGTMLYLECAVKRPAALGNGHEIAELTDRADQGEQIAVAETFLVRRGGRTFLPVWFISQDAASRSAMSLLA